MPNCTSDPSPCILCGGLHRAIALVPVLVLLRAHQPVHGREEKGHSHLCWFQKFQIFFVVCDVCDVCAVCDVCDV